MLTPDQRYSIVATAPDPGNSYMPQTSPGARIIQRSWSESGVIVRAMFSRLGIRPATSEGPRMKRWFGEW
ncbi:hypothetical protein [Xanthomonas phage XPV3]|uniref:Uncharacterized protein n=1 Tax=Xanthomonas phage XPV1 TaxID=2099860 RepID=A0A3S7I6A9_9CAUD|nr:hypothetical protein KEM12_gp20 [Xanthomonas phage XPV1]AVO24184.1 hypothetical protein [Xanthomonas phage XPV1]AVO24351.1 hypothetical protein [Xanthomonas phage XPV3]